MEILVRRDDYDMQFSRGILAKSLILSGLTPLVAYQISEEIREELLNEKRLTVTSDEIFERVREKIKAVHPKLERKYRLWRQIEYCDMPMTILIGSGSGVGSTSVAAELGYRLGIPRVIGTDIIREILRQAISKDFLPTIHTSTYEAWKHLKTPVSEGEDRELIGFRSQAHHVCMGVEALLERSIHENISMIVEGTHLVPSFIDKKFLEQPNVFFFILDIPNEATHRNRFLMRAQTSGREAEKYLSHFKTIRRIQEYIVKNARKSSVNIIEQESISESVECIADKVMERMVDTLKCHTKKR